MEVNNKKYLKILLQDNIPGLTFRRPLNRIYSEQLCSSDFKAKMVDDAMSNRCDDFSSIYQAAEVIRNDWLKYRNWKFDGEFLDFEIHSSLSVLLKWIIIGTKSTIYADLKKRSLDTRINNIFQIIIKATKGK